jgi:hypothetical protein
MRGPLGGHALLEMDLTGPEPFSQPNAVSGAGRTVAKRRNSKRLGLRIRGLALVLLLTPFFDLANVSAQLEFDSASHSRQPLTCTPSSVVRGEHVRCVMSAPGWKVTGWEFVPDGSEGGPRLPIVRDTITSNEWAGPVAIGGQVTVHVKKGADTAVFHTRFVVTPRKWCWPCTWR